VRGRGPFFAAQRRGMPPAEYLASANDDVFVAILVELPEAVDNIEAIAAVPSVGELGHPGDTGHPEVMSAFRRVEAAALAAGVPIGGFEPDADAVVALVQRGYRNVAVGFDWSVYQRAVAARWRPSSTGELPKLTRRGQVQRRRDMRNRVPRVDSENLTRTVDAYPPDQDTVDRVLGGSHHNPHGVLGAHAVTDGTVVRTVRPHADEVAVLVGGDPERAYPLVRVHEAGLWSGVIAEQPGDYRLRVRYGDDVHTVDDPYRWLPTLGEIDLHLIGEGRHERLWDVLGAHVRNYDTSNGQVSGTSFAVWAPGAHGVRVTGDFDGWAGWTHPMRSLGSSGVWEIFVPGVGVGNRYKFRILGPDGVWREKSDPMAFATEVPPSTASVVTALHHEWGDEEWLEQRARSAPHKEPMSVYEVHLGSWRQGLSYREAAHQLVDYLAETGFTHVELLPVAEHPFGGSWGYQVTSFYAPTARFGTPDDFRYFVDTLHQAGYGIIVDWVPWHGSTAPRCTSTPTPAAASSRTGARTSSTSVGARCATSSSRTRCSGWTSTTWTGCASTRWHRCSTWTTRDRKGSGCPTSTAAGRTSTPSRSCRR
jgi:hypothetical protein